MQKTKKWLNYWKISLLDSIKANIEIDKYKDAGFVLEDYKIDDQTINVKYQVELVKLFKTKQDELNKKNKKDFKQLEQLEILIAPFSYAPKYNRQENEKNQSAAYPVWFAAKIDRSGKLSLADNLIPFFQRANLEPIADNKSSVIVSSTDEVDKAITKFVTCEYKQYTDYVAAVKELFLQVIAGDDKNIQIDGYDIGNAHLILPKEDINASASIVELYNYLLACDELPELLLAMANINNDKQQNPIAIADIYQTNTKHLGQMGYEFPLSISQRQSLYTFQASNSRVFAVNGPPGTGKTTLLQSVVANMLVEKAIAGDNPPVILACSTNNQAVTNIIESFSNSKTRDGLLEGRWLPDVKGYATYLPSASKDGLEDINYKKLDGSGLFANIENTAYLEKAKDYFKQKASEYLKTTSSIKDISIVLQNKIKSIQHCIEQSGGLWADCLSTQKIVLTEIFQEQGDGKFLDSQSLQNKTQQLQQLEQEVIKFFNQQSIIRKIFCWLKFKSALQAQYAELRVLLRNKLEFSPTKATQIDLLENINSKLVLLDKAIGAQQRWSKWQQESQINSNPPISDEEYWDCIYQKKSLFYDELDMGLRHEAFQLALHYWEARWLLQLETDLNKQNTDLQNKKGLEVRKNMWYRLSMLTPCFVSTFYMAPKFFSYAKHVGKDENNKNIYDNPPLVDFIDLLIVDESGQVTPEVGVAAFALAKQAMVVGDIKQIEPVWSITAKIDYGNLKAAQLIENYDTDIVDKEYDHRGFLASTGSIMKMAQNAAEIKIKNIKEKGMLLVEHRRCYDEIINYCNELAYEGQLRPLKGSSQGKGLLFPSMMGIHVEGNSITQNSSRYNLNEVKAIADWLLMHKDEIKQKYQQDIEQCVGIVTPFTGQKNRLISALKAKGFNTSIMKIGTVHALQGAERQIVLCSMVYGQGDSGTMFFDRGPNMLNVAVSRAKDNFIVFVNKKILDNSKNTASGILAKYLEFTAKDKH